MATSLPTLLLAGLLTLHPSVTGPATPGCTAGGSDAAAADVERALAACRTARARFGELFGDSVPAVHIVLHEDSGYEVASAGSTGIVFWPSTRALSAAHGATGAAHAQWREVLPHEVMHALTMAAFYRGGGAGGHGGYGTPLPDWFEEGIAIWGEPEESRLGRIRQARRLPAARQDLAGILAAAHPVAGNATLMAPVPGAPAPRDESLRAFYPQSIAVLSFVLDAGGTAAIRELAVRLVADPGDGAALVGLPGLPPDRGGLEAEWRRWLSQDTR